jgi:hypoxanthine phosphoribosyltransferase
MPHLTAVLSRAEIHKKIKALGKRISEDYGGQEIVIVGVLKGAFIFLADLVRELRIPVQIDFVQLASYGSGMSSAGHVAISKELELDIACRHVLVVEDITDSGLTIAYLVDYLKRFRPASLKVCVFINKTERRQVDVLLDYVGHTVKAGFLVGYGLDYNGSYRALPELYHLKV